MKAAIQIKEIGYAYGDVAVLENISFEIEAGTFFIIIGPNGSGKTTLLKMIAGIIKSSHGDIKIQDREIDTYSRKQLARMVAYVPQINQIDFPFTVKEIVLMGRAPHLGLLGLTDTKDIVLAEEALAFTGVTHLAGRRLDQLSGGECQRVLIARAICQAPRVILLDEPTASLDLAHQVRLMDLMDRLKSEKGVTVVMVSHDVNLASMYSDCLALLRQGKLLGLGSPREVLTHALLESAYDCKLLVDQSPFGKVPRITLVPEKIVRKK
jgi:iron complex transport system ATP-binding protein